MPSTSLIAIIVRCTTIQFADCAQPTRMNNPRNPDRTHGRNETSHIKTEPCIARRGSWAATPRAPSSGPPPASTCPHAAEKWAGEGSRGEGKGGRTAWGGSRSFGTSARCGWWWPPGSRTRQGTPPTKPSHRAPATRRPGLAFLCADLLS